MQYDYYMNHKVLLVMHFSQPMLGSLHLELPFMRENNYLVSNKDSKSDMDSKFFQPLQIKIFNFATFAIFAIATYQKIELFCLQNCVPHSKVRLRWLRNCDFIAIAIRNFAIIAIFAIHFTTLVESNHISYTRVYQDIRLVRYSSYLA